MFIEIHELERHPVDFDWNFPPGSIELGTDLRQGSLRSFKRELARYDHGDD
jgi:hypothetical protein